MSTPAIGSTQRLVLAILDRGPSYASEMVKAHPELVGSKQVSDVIVVDQAALYTKLKRMTKRGLIERMNRYKPPDPAQYSRLTRKRAVWYRLTPEGRKILQEHRQMREK